MPHPAEGRPIFSQDTYAPPPETKDRERPHEEEFTQDRFDLPDKPDYSKELRRVPEKGRELSEVEIAKGIIKLNASQYDQAERHFKAALDKDPRNFVAMEYLGAVEEGRGRLDEAIAWYVKAKHAAPEGRWGALNFQLGRLYLFTKNYERGEIYLRLAIKEGGHLAASNYTLGYLLYKQGRLLESHYYFQKARERALRPAARAEERAMMQSIHYYMGDIYARLGYAHYAIANLRETEYGPSWEIRNAAWRVHSQLNRSDFRLAAGTFVQYDTNTILLPNGRTLPGELSSQGGISNVTTAEAGWASSPAKAWSFGVDGSLYVNTHADQALSTFDVLSLGGDLWVNYWNRRDWIFAARYDLAHALVDRNDYTTFQNTHGPGVSASYAPFQRWNYELGLNYRLNNYPDDLSTGPDRRNGTAYIAFLRVGLKSPNPRIRPVFGYTFELDDTVGDNFDNRMHTLSAEAAWQVFTKTHLIGGVSFGKHSYPNHLTGRSDTRTQFRLGATHIINEHWQLLVDMMQLDNSSSNDDFDYSRFTFTTGAMYRL